MSDGKRTPAHDRAEYMNIATRIDKATRIDEAAWRLIENRHIGSRATDILTTVILAVERHR